jgi:hypothetical protein
MIKREWREQEEKNEGRGERNGEVLLGSIGENRMKKERREKEFSGKEKLEEEMKMKKE